MEGGLTAVLGMSVSYDPSRMIASPFVFSSESSFTAAAATSAGSMSRPPGLIRAIAWRASFVFAPHPPSPPLGRGEEVRGLSKGGPGGHALRSDLVDAPDFSGEFPAGRVLIPAEVAPGELVQVLVGALLGDLRHGVPDGEVAVRIVRVRDLEGHVGPLLHIPVLEAALGRVDQNMLAVIVDPYGSDVRRAIGHLGRQVSEGPLLEEIEKLLRDGAGGRVLLAPPVVARDEGGVLLLEPVVAHPLAPRHEPVGEGHWVQAEVLADVLEPGEALGGGLLELVHDRLVGAPKSGGGPPH